MLVWLSSRPKLLLPVLSIALLIGGLALPPLAGLPLLVVLTALVGWLTYLSWPAADVRGKVLRSLSVGLLAVLVVTRL